MTFPDFQEFTYLELAVRRYPLYPLCLVSSMAGIIAICQLCALASARLPKLTAPLCYIGRHSMTLLCIHSIDACWRSLWYIESNQFPGAAIRLGIDLSLFALWMLTAGLFKKLYAKKRHAR